MKRQNIIGIYVICAFLLSSCLAESGKKIGFGDRPAVYESSPEPVFVIEVTDGTNGIDKVQYSNIENLNASNGDCYLINFIVDFESDDNKSVTSGGFYTVENASAELLPLDIVKPELTDTANFMPNGERTTKSIQKRYSYIKKRLFIFSNHSIEKESEKESGEKHYNKIDLSFEPDQAPEVDETVGYPVYELFYRVEVAKEGEGTPNSSLSYVENNAFAMNNFMEKFGPAQKNANRDSLCFRINYASRFDNDTTFITWASSDIFKIPIEL